MTEPVAQGAPYTEIQRIIGTATAFNWVVNIDPAFGFVYFENPKVACSTIKATLNLAVSERDGIPLSYASMADVHDRKANPMTNPYRIGRERFDALMRDRDVFRFTYVRDPYRRFCSAFLSKIGSKPLRRRPIARRLAAEIGLDPDKPLSFQAFADLVTGDPALRDFDPHWRLQRDQIAFDVVDYGFIGRHERFAESFGGIVERLFPGQGVKPFDSRVAFGRRTASQDLAAELSAGTKKKIEAAYAADFEMLEDVAARFG